MERTKLAIIGTGTIGTIYAKIVKQMYEADLVAIHDISEKRVRSLADELNTKAYSGSSYEPLFQENPDIEGVLICTPQDHHVEPALMALGAGKHVQIEKPLASNISDARKIVRAASGRDIVSMMNYSLRFDPRYVAVKEASDKGEIGQIRYIYAQRNPPLAGVGSRVRAGEEELPYWSSVHDIDMIRWITSSEVTSVYATSTSIGYEKEKFIGAILTNLTLQNGSLAVLENAWREAIEATGKLLSIASFKIQGTRGFVEIRNSEQGVKVVSEGITYMPDIVNMPVVSNQIVGVYTAQTHHFVHCIREKKPSGISLTDGLMGVVIADAILRSVKEKRVISVQDDWQDIITSER
jgi:predicted dehydrogenase